MRDDLPTGTVTFLFTDIEGSTELLHRLGTADYGAVLAEHRRLLRDAFTAHGGIEVDTQGDAFFVAFPTTPGALAAASDAQRVLADLPLRVRMGMHTGTSLLTDGDAHGHWRRRYSANQLADECGPEWQLTDAERYVHTTPLGVAQNFVYSTFRRVAPSSESNSPS